MGKKLKPQGPLVHLVGQTNFRVAEPTLSKQILEIQKSSGPNMGKRIIMIQVNAFYFILCLYRFIIHIKWAGRLTFLG